MPAAVHDGPVGDRGQPSALRRGAGGSQDGGEQLAELQRELFEARVAVNRAGANLNQAVAQLNVIGDAPVWLVDAVRRVVKAVQRIDAATFRVHDRLR
ncbi:hypothetical protein [Phytohabitans suffuscus]|uniref:Bacterial mobilisation domain-containing protein n=1 Tax=Phytohabitans suffuscus TaxID=624315 RepID=A0A6F8YT78_9ACTN|nr:hypothetical protein [Phytohabitans suffuscus]BCB89269.1 hypothetical protein Psuf_065820 [Phytohabitans suffuscus]